MRTLAEAKNFADCASPSSQFLDLSCRRLGVMPRHSILIGSQKHGAGQGIWAESGVSQLCGEQSGIWCSFGSLQVGSRKMVVLPVVLLKVTEAIGTLCGRKAQKCFKNLAMGSSR
jgi:hypothetical protein